MLPYVESPFSANGMMKITKVISWNACKALVQWDGSSDKGAWHTDLVTRVDPQSPIKAVGGNQLRKVGLWPPQLFCGNSERPNHHEIYKRANKNHFTVSLHGSKLCLGGQRNEIASSRPVWAISILGTRQDGEGACLESLAIWIWPPQVKVKENSYHRAVFWPLCVFGVGVGRHMCLHTYYNNF